MQLAIIRHAPAESRGRFARTGRPDAERPLTEEGRTKFTQAARGLRAWLDGFDLLATSAFRRAHQTAELVSEAYGGLPIEVWKELEPEATVEDVARRLQGAQERRRIAVVSHRPLVENLAAYLVSGSAATNLELKKGSVCLVELPEGPAHGKGSLLASVPMGVLRKLRQ